MNDSLDVSLQDDELLAEIKLATTLMIAAGASECRLSAAEVDRLLELGAVLPSQRGTRGRSRRSRRQDWRADQTPAIEGTQQD